MTKKSPFRYNQDEMAKALIELQQNCEREMAEAFQQFHSRKAVMAFQAGYLQALKDYKIQHDAPAPEDMG